MALVTLTLDAATLARARRMTRAWHDKNGLDVAALVERRISGHVT